MLKVDTEHMPLDRKPGLEEARNLYGHFHICKLESLLKANHKELVPLSDQLYVVV